jgi:large subunit ribosomal protein L17
MRHLKAGSKLGRTTAHRKATMRNLAAGLFEHGQITTTVQKGKAVQPFAEKLITLAKRGDLHSRRLVVARLQDRIMTGDESQLERNRYGDLRKGPKLIKHLFEEVAPRYKDRPGGCTRLIKLDKRRKGDGGELCVLQLVGDEQGPEIGGRVSVRRRIADGRTEFAAKLRKASAKKSKPKKETPPADEAPATDAAE